jgi:putative Mn2+ efflux pump MntP
MIVGLKEAHRSYQELTLELKGSQNVSKILLSAFKVNAYFQWFMNGAVAVTSTVATAIQNSKLMNFLGKLGPITGAVAAGSLLLVDIKNLHALLTAETLDTAAIKATLLSMLANICMVIAPILMLTLAVSQPHVAFAIIIALGIIAVACHIAKEWEWMQANPEKAAIYLTAMALSFLAPQIPIGVLIAIAGALLGIYALQDDSLLQKTPLVN